MRNSIGTAALLLALAQPTRGQSTGFEFSLRVGQSDTGLDSTFASPVAGRYRLARADILQTGGGFRLLVEGGGALGLSAAYRPIGPVFIEARYDRASFTPDPKSEQVVFQGTLPDGISASAVGDVPDPRMEFDRLSLWSANAGVRVGGRVAVHASGGVTRLPKLTFRVDQSIALANLDLETGFSVPFTAIAPSAGETGWNAGGGVSVRVARRAIVGLEARVFRFKERRFNWQPAPFLPVGFENTVLDRLRRGPSPVTLDPSLHQVVAFVNVTL